MARCGSVRTKFEPDSFCTHSRRQSFTTERTNTMTHFRWRVGRRLFQCLSVVACLGAAGIAAGPMIKVPRIRRICQWSLTNRSKRSTSQGHRREKRRDGRQKALLEKRYDLSDNASDVQMSGKRKAVQQGVRVKLPSGAELGQARRHDARADQASRTLSRWASGRCRT